MTINLYVFQIWSMTEVSKTIMKANINTRIFLLVTTLFLFGVSTFAQDAKPPETQPTPNPPQDVKTNVLRQLGLSQEQVQQIRRVNMARKPLMDEAQKRSREANRLLDEAIYADTINEADVQSRLKDVQLAQAEVAKIRFMNEVAVRRILTSEQLVRFRELRQRFEKVRENNETRRPMQNGERVNKRQDPNVTTLRDVKQKVRTNQMRPQL